MTFQEAKEGTFNTFIECYNNTIEKNPDAKFAKVKDFMTTQGFTFIKSTEERLRCASVCRPGLFYLSIDVSEGKPDADCLNKMIEELPNMQKGAGLVSLVTALVLLVGFAFSFPLCTGFSQDHKI